MPWQSEELRVVDLSEVSCLRTPLPTQGSRSSAPGSGLRVYVSLVASVVVASNTLAQVFPAKTRPKAATSRDPTTATSSGLDQTRDPPRPPRLY